jgi:DNA repair ATPase RecN
MHGPHDHQSLLHPARQLAILDAFVDQGLELIAQLGIAKQLLDLFRRGAGNV